MKDLNHKQTLGMVIVTALLCALFMFSSFIGELLYSKIKSNEVPTTKIETCVKCEKCGK